MAKVELLAPLILKWEGGFVNDPKDKGGATNMGITLSTWQKQGYDKNHDGHIDENDIKLLDVKDFIIILNSYWNTWKANNIEDQKLANICVDWVWGSGAWGVKLVQRLLGLTEDGVVGNLTLSTLNSQNPQDFLKMVYNARLEFLNNIVKRDSSQSRFIKGWTNRLNSFL